MPHSVLKEAQDNLINYHGTGRSIMEMSHRGSTVTKVSVDNSNQPPSDDYVIFLKKIQGCR